MKKVFILFILSICVSANAQGVWFDYGKYDSMKEFDFESLGFTDLPKSYSLRKYAPEPHQQVGNSCVGFTVAYAAMSIQYNKELGVTSKTDKKYFAFDPYFIYSMISSKYYYDCREKTYMYDALKALENYGCKRLWTVPFLDCKNKATTESYSFAKPFRVKGTYNIPKETIKNGPKVISILKQTLNYGRVPVLGIKITNTMASTDFADGTVKKNGLWKPSFYDKEAGGHAVSIIGYNDYKFGGCFEIMNSWGSDYGDNGFMWIKYDDLVSIMSEFYMIDTYSVSESSCKVGNCNNGYGSKVIDNVIEEGEFYNGELDGYGFRTAKDGSGIYIGYFKEGELNGRGMIYDKQSNKTYGIVSKNGKIQTTELLGFSSADNEKDKEFDSFLDEMKKRGHIMLSDDDLPSNIYDFSLN